MKTKIFKCITKGECSLHLTCEKAAFVAAGKIQDSSTWEQAEIDMEEKLGKNDEDWDNEDWGMFCALYIGRAEKLSLIEPGAIIIAVEEIEISQEPVSCYGFTGTRVGCIDIDSGVMSKEAEQVIRTAANAVVDLEQPEFSFFLVEDDNEMWAEADEVIESGEVILDETRQAEVKDELRRFRSFLLHNNIWWLRFIGW